MKILLLMRHAKSSWDDYSLTDHDRPLNERGKKDAAAMGDFLNVRGNCPQIALCSSAKRAKQTAQYLLEGLPFEGELRIIPNFYPGDTEEYIHELQSLSENVEVALVVSHNMAVEDAVFHFTDKDEVMSTATIAQIGFDIQQWSDLTMETEGQLLHLWRPKEIG
ncbi:MAG: histidine phosphatase family protein [Anaerolineales bacterium]|nr:histidine phosphatase family protein [Anaerolineales bacterium]